MFQNDRLIGIFFFHPGNQKLQCLFFYSVRFVDYVHWSIAICMYRKISKIISKPYFVFSFLRTESNVRFSECKRIKTIAMGTVEDRVENVFRSVRQSAIRFHAVLKYCVIMFQSQNLKSFYVVQHETNCFYFHFVFLYVYNIYLSVYIYIPYVFSFFIFHFSKIVLTINKYICFVVAFFPCLARYAYHSLKNVLQQT